MNVSSGPVSKTRKTQVLSAADAGSIEAAADVLRRGGLAAFPTETVYGLGADATSDETVAEIFEAKQRPHFNPLISHVALSSQAQSHGHFDKAALCLAQAFWPGPLTLVVPVGSGCEISLLARAGLDTVALRVPAHPVAQQLLEAYGKPVAAPSANKSGFISPTNAAHVLTGLDGRIDLILDGGACGVGLESTIVACCEGQPRILRPGGVARERIEAVLKVAGIFLADPQIEEKDGQAIVAPGMLASHYAPQAKVRLNAVEVGSGEAVLDFAGVLKNYSASAPGYRDLSPTGSTTEAAARLFAYLRELDTSNPAAIAIAPVPSTDLGEAINDRLARAAADRTK